MDGMPEEFGKRWARRGGSALIPILGVAVVARRKSRTCARNGMLLFATWDTLW